MKLYPSIPFVCTFYAFCAFFALCALPACCACAALFGKQLAEPLHDDVEI